MVSLKEVADASGVSIATASRALNKKPRVSQRTAAHVLAVAAELGYEANPLAKALKEGSDGIIGIVVPMIGNPFFSMLVHEFENQLEKIGLTVFIADSRGEVDREAERLSALASRRVRGVIVVPASFEESGDALLRTASRVPLVQVDRRTERDAHLPFVGVDNTMGVHQSLSHVHELGARSVAYVGADARTSVGRDRSRAFAEQAQALGLEVHAPIIDRFLYEFGVEAAHVLTERSRLPDAVIAGDDLIAAGLVGGLARQDIHTPRDIMVTGFDGTYLAEITAPTLTTVSQPFDALVATAVRLLQQQIDGSPGTTEHLLLPTTLKPGQSTGAVAS